MGVGRDQSCRRVEEHGVTDRARPAGEQVPDDAGVVRRVAAAQVLEVCDRRSVAEVSALTKMPIGVTRVLLGDLIEQGLVRIQATITDSTSTDERLELIERTLRGLRNY